MTAELCCTTVTHNSVVVHTVIPPSNTQTKFSAVHCYWCETTALSGRGLTSVTSHLLTTC